MTDPLSLHRSAVLIAARYVARGEKTPAEAADGLRQLGIPAQAADMRAITEAQMARDQYAREAHAAETKTRDWDTRYRDLINLLLDGIPREALQ